MTTRVAAYPVWRAHDLFWPLENAPASLKRNPADEVYWMSWDHSFAGKAVIRVARNDGDILVTRRYWACRFGKARCRSARLTTTDWALLEDAVVAAGFWLLDEQIIFDLGCDGATWLIAGRRGGDYRHLRRRSPNDRAVRSRPTDVRSRRAGRSQSLTTRR
jgi:hypothetical protein